MKDKVRLAIIGCGGMAGAHLSAYIRLKKSGIDIFDFVAMCDVDAERANGFAVKAAEGKRGYNPKFTRTSIKCSSRRRWTRLTFVAHIFSITRTRLPALKLDSMSLLRSRLA